jgi:hypothetical protein
MNRTGLGVVLIALGAGACASTPAPYERVASSEAAIRAAREVGSEQVPQASLHLKLAEESVQKAKAQIRDGDNNAAAFTLLRAQADAELALALARENKTRADAQLVIEKARAIGGGPSDANKAPPAASPSQPPAPPAQNPTP